MRLQLTVTVDKGSAHDVVVGDVIVGTHTHVVTHAAHSAFSGLVGELGEEGIAIHNVAETLSLIDTPTDIAAVVEAIAGEEVPSFQAVVGRKTCAVHPRIATPNVDRTIEALPLVLFQNDIDDTCRAFRIVTHGRIGNHFDTLNHVAL